MKKPSYLDKHEMELAKSLENEEWISDFTKKEKKQYEEYARYSLSKRKRINIRMSERDLKKIQAKAIEEGIPYQSLISMLIHKYNEGKLSIIILSDAPPHILCHILKSKRSQMLPGGDTCFFIPSTLLIVIFKQLSKLLFV